MEDFLKELILLTQKHNIGIGGCGCYGSPFLFNVVTNEVIAENLEYEESNYRIVS